MLITLRATSVRSVWCAPLGVRALNPSCISLASSPSPTSSPTSSRSRTLSSRPSRPPTSNGSSRPPSSTQTQSKRVPRTPSQIQSERPSTPPHLLTLADLSTAEISGLLTTALTFKTLCKSHPTGASAISKSMSDRTVALIFSKRSTRTRVASETGAKLLGGHPMFLGSADIQLGVNETLMDTAKVVGSMVDGIMARVNGHEEVEELAKYSPVPVINALSDLYHPTQILADLLTLHELYTPTAPEVPTTSGRRQSALYDHLSKHVDPLASLKGKKMAWVGDTNNIINELLVTVPRMGMKLAVASPKGYDKVDPRVWARVTEAGSEKNITLTNSPEEALHDADVVVTDTWISMGQETEKADRLAAFKGYQITNSMVNGAGAKPDWKFLHCLPRKQEEVDDEVFYGERSLVFPEAENRKWTIMACFDALYGRWRYPTA